MPSHPAAGLCFRVGVRAEGGDVAQLRSGACRENKADVDEGFRNNLQLSVLGERIERCGHPAFDRVLHGHNCPRKIAGGHRRERFVHTVCGDALRVGKTAIGDQAQERGFREGCRWAQEPEAQGVCHRMVS